MQILIQFLSTLVIGFLVAYIVRFVIRKVIRTVAKPVDKVGKSEIFGFSLPVAKLDSIPTIIFAVMMFNTVMGALGVLGWDADIIKIMLLLAGLDQIFNKGGVTKKLLS